MYTITRTYLLLIWPFPSAAISSFVHFTLSILIICLNKYLLFFVRLDKQWFENGGYVHRNVT